MTYRKLLVLVILSGIMSGVFLMAKPVSAVAVPGCYTTSSSESTDASPARCPDSVSATDAKSKCFLILNVSSIFSLPKEVNCSTITNSADPTGNSDGIVNPEKDGKYQCGKGDGNVVTTGFDFGCLGPKYTGLTGKLNPIVDIAFAIFRFLSAGVGLIVIGSIIVAGIQYSASRGDPQAITQSRARITNSIIGLLIYIFIFAIANFLVPGGMFIQ